ncbi:hypothetical protein ABG79_02196 [Caloramator mitchellensis]|uniref:Uncharacterized protein n=1 Tax=Caloramator mitchellensis TaxID=908809 RepID=A0A0R3JRG2_CALMK|nr:hypothetical protein [Caloramator mitchellensis]KRQ86064.1 hypothetical protein ABG79_02196 [Caloramator mitchellensis]
MDAIVLGKINQLKSDLLYEKFIPVNKTINVSGTTTNFVEVVNITGSGFISEAIAVRHTFGAGQQKGGFLQITIDNVLMLAVNFISYVDPGGSTKYYGVSGFATKDYIYSANGYSGVYNTIYQSSYQNTHTFKEIEPLPYTETPNLSISLNSYGAICSFSFPLFFKNSLKIKVKALNSDSSAPIYVELRGGLKV